MSSVLKKADKLNLSLSLVGLGGSPWVVQLHFGQRITMDFVMSVAVHSRG